MASRGRARELPGVLHNWHLDQHEFDKSRYFSSIPVCQSEGRNRAETSHVCSHSLLSFEKFPSVWYGTFFKHERESPRQSRISHDLSASPPLCIHDFTLGYSTFSSSILLLSSGPALRSVAPSHLSSLHLPATNHNLFTTPRAHSTTLLAPIADLFIPDNAEGLASLIWDSVRRVYIPRSDCLSSTLVRLNSCHTEPSRAVFFFLKACKEMTEEEILCRRFHSEFSSRARWEATSSTSVDGGK